MGLTALDWGEAFRRLRAVVYVIITAAAVALASGSAPETKPAYRTCAIDLRDLFGRNPNVGYDYLFPAGVSDTQFCEMHSTGQGGPFAAKIARVNIEAAKKESLLWEQSKHFGEFLGAAALVIIGLEIAAQTVLWVLAGLLRRR